MASPADFVGKRWVTRPRPHVDRLAWAWLIRRFIDPNAAIRYSNEPEPDEISSDMDQSQFGHVGNRCTFETVIAAFGLAEPGLREMSEIVHAIDLQDGQYSQPETAGIDAILTGWLRAGLADDELERQGIALFEGLYQAMSRRARRTPATKADPKQKRKRKKKIKRGGIG